MNKKAKQEKIKIVKNFLKVIHELERLHGHAANHISRKDNNEVLDMSFRLRETCRRILKDYDLPITDPYFRS